MTLLDENEVEWRFIRATGPGGQKVNKKRPRPNFALTCPKSSLLEEIKERLVPIAGNRINTEGELVITG